MIFGLYDRPCCKRASPRYRVVDRQRPAFLTSNVLVFLILTLTTQAFAYTISRVKGQQVVVDINDQPLPKTNQTFKSLSGGRYKVKRLGKRQVLATVLAGEPVVGEHLEVDVSDSVPSLDPAKSVNKKGAHTLFLGIPTTLPGSKVRSEYTIAVTGNPASKVSSETKIDFSVGFDMGYRYKPIDSWWGLDGRLKVFSFAARGSTTEMIVAIDFAPLVHLYASGNFLLNLGLLGSYLRITPKAQTGESPLTFSGNGYGVLLAADYYFADAWCLQTGAAYRNWKIDSISFSTANITQTQSYVFQVAELILGVGYTF